MREALTWPLAAAAACAAAIGAVLFGSWTVVPIEHLDARILAHFAIHDTPHFDPLAQSVAHAADFLPLALILAALCVFALVRREPERAAAAVFVVAGANVTTQVLKAVLAHPRFQQLAPLTNGPAGFPSGHATAAMSVAVAAVLVAPESARTLVMAVAAGFAFAVSASLLVLAWHMPSEVLGGWLMALGWGFLALSGLRYAAAAPLPLQSPQPAPPTTSSLTLPVLGRD